jgi:hypothetical protein
MERLKRLRAAQLNKQFQKDAVTVAQKRLAEEKDRQARLQIERAALGSRRSPSPISTAVQVFQLIAPTCHCYRARLQPLPA